MNTPFGRYVVDRRGESERHGQAGQRKMGSFQDIKKVDEAFKAEMELLLDNDASVKRQSN